MGVNLTVVWDLLDKLLEAGNDFVEAQVETVYGTIHTKLKEQVAKTTTLFDDHSLVTVEIGLRDKLNKLYPADQFPPD